MKNFLETNLKWEKKIPRPKGKNQIKRNQTQILRTFFGKSSSHVKWLMIFNPAQTQGRRWNLQFSLVDLILCFLLLSITIMFFVVNSCCFYFCRTFRFKTIWNEIWVLSIQTWLNPIRCSPRPEVDPPAHPRWERSSAERAKQKHLFKSPQSLFYFLYFSGVATKHWSMLKLRDKASLRVI